MSDASHCMAQHWSYLALATTCGLAEQALVATPYDTGRYLLFPFHDMRAHCVYGDHSRRLEDF